MLNKDETALTENINISDIRDRSIELGLPITTGETKKVLQIMNNRYIEFMDKCIDEYIVSTIEQDCDYWDCSCKDDFIHHKSIKACPTCGNLKKGDCYE